MIYISFIVLSFLWGTSFIAIKVALTAVKPIELLALRWLISFFLFLFLIISGRVKVSYRDKPISKLILLVAFQPCLYALFETIGVDLTTSSESSIFIGVIPLIVALEGWIFFKKKISKKLIFAMTIAFIGLTVSVVMAPNFSSGGKWHGYAALLIAVAAGGMYSLIGSMLTKHFSFIEITFAMALGGAFFFNLISFVNGNGLTPYAYLLHRDSAALSILYLGVGCSFCAYLLYNYTLSKLNAAVASSLQTNLITVVGVVSGIVLGGDVWGWYTILGLTLTIIGIYIASTDVK